MRRPDPNELRQLKSLRNYPAVLDYLRKVEEDYIDQLISCTDIVTIHQVQGALSTIRTLVSFITTED
jgi:hypothetical protein